MNDVREAAEEAKREDERAESNEERGRYVAGPAMRFVNAFTDPSPITPEALAGLGFSERNEDLVYYTHPHLSGILFPAAHKWRWQVGAHAYDIATIGHLRHLLAALNHRKD